MREPTPLPGPTSPSLSPPPPREPWEAPPPGGWGSGLRGVGLAVLALVALVGAGIAELRIVWLARRLGRHHSIGLRHPELIALWALALVVAAALAVYLWRQRDTIALALAMWSDQGRVSRVRGRPPVFLDEAPARAFRLAQLSDLHLAEADDVRLVEREHPAGNRVFARLLESPALDESDAILFTGDITDRGTAGAWRAFFAALDRHAERNLADKIVLVPGNHDLNLVEPFDPKGPLELLRGRTGEAKRAIETDRFGVVQLGNLLKFADAFSKTGGGRRGLALYPGGGRAGAPVPWAEAFALVEKSVRPFIESLHAEPAPPPRRHPFQRGRIAEYERHIEEARRQLLALFPIAVPFPAHEAVLFVLNSSTTVSRHPATNALGGIGAAQMERLRRLARQVHGNLRLVALHHHLVRRGEEAGSDFVSRLFARFSTLGDAYRLLRFCEEERVRAVWNGHRHLSYQLRLPIGTVLCAAPSSTLGDELTDDPRPLIERYDVAPVPSEPSVGIYRAVVRPG